MTTTSSNQTISQYQTLVPPPPLHSAPSLPTPPPPKSLTTAAGAANRALTKPLEPTQHLVKPLISIVPFCEYNDTKIEPAQCRRCFGFEFVSTNRRCFLGFCRQAPSWGSAPRATALLPKQRTPPPPNLTRSIRSLLLRTTSSGILIVDLIQPSLAPDDVLFITVGMQQLQMSFDLMPPMHGFSCYKSDRLHKAIKALFVTPQSNFRVFLNGSVIYGGLGGGSDSISHMIGKEDVLRNLMFDSGAIHAYYNFISQPWPRKEKDIEFSFSSVFLKSTNQIFDYKNFIFGSIQHVEDVSHAGDPAGVGGVWVLLLGGQTQWTVVLVAMLISISNIIVADTYAFVGGKVAKYLPSLGSHYHQCYSISKPTLELQIMQRAMSRSKMCGAEVFAVFGSPNAI
ncbi:hypothetical protein RHSIM_Rhsim05G0129700 [Rhododendron simsii]|uniref:Inositol-pentakisphosphate 2-kinase n=1 Tax=Rhododendron simsii TaxID=118357 RepID=A0A834LR65_RHOSS|nr:hypothetical protein RHSIM_Rhsim05G0129700 [Rhododendron simsii]